MNILKRISMLEQKQPQKQTCYPLRYFYGEHADPEPLVIGQTIADFYNQHNEAQNGIFIN